MKQFKIAYIRVSTPMQDPTRQKLNILAKCPECLIIEEKYTGTTMERPMWSKLMASCEKGRISDIYFDEPSRMGRTEEECVKSYKHLYFDLHINLHFIKSSHIDTEVYESALNSILVDMDIQSGDEAANEMIKAILGAVHSYQLNMIENQIKYAFKKAEDEAKLLSERTKSGLALARKKGKQIGSVKGEHYRSKIEWKAMPLILKYYKGFGGAYDIAGVAKICGLTYVTTRKYIANIINEQNVDDKNDLLKYADKKAWTMIIKDTDAYRKEAEKIWMKAFGTAMTWQKVPKRRKNSVMHVSLQASSGMTDKSMR